MNISRLSLFESVIFQPFIIIFGLFSDLLKLKYLVHNLQVVFGFTNELVNIHKSELNRFCVVIYGHSKSAVLYNCCAFAVGYYYAQVVGHFCN